MKIRTCRTRNAFVASLVILCTACGGQPAKEAQHSAEAAPAAGYFIGSRPVYAHLVSNKDGSWVFRAITASDEPSDTSYLVRLNDLTPAFDTRVAECTPQVYPESHRCNPANPFRDEDSGVLDKIINSSIAVGTAGKITDITYAYETTFDETDFNRAVDEAILNSGLDRHRLISLLSTYDEELRLAREDLQLANQRMQALRSGSEHVDVEIQPRLGGLLEYYQGDIDFAQLVDLETADEAPPPMVLEPADILPCEARKCVTAADSALAALRIDVQRYREQLSAGTRSTSRRYSVRCDMVSFGSYLLQAECPAEIVVTGDTPVNLPINVTILSRDFDDLYPALVFGDPDLRIGIDGKSVSFSNTTGEYLTVSAQTVYYNSTVHTTALPIDIPPGITVTRDLKEFVSQAIDIESRYLQMTPDKASGASFRFGFAVRYQLASQLEERTLHNMDTFNVGCAIENRMRPGSCEPEMVAEAGTPADAPPTGEKRLGPM